MISFANRIARLRQALGEGGFDALLTEAPADIRYFTGCPDVGGYLVVESRDDVWLLTTAHDWPQANAVVADSGAGIEVEQWRPGEDPIKLVGRRLGGRQRRRVAVPSLSMAAFLALTTALDGSGTALLPTPTLTSDLRRVKEAAELDLIRQGARIVEAGMATVREALRPGVREIEVAAEAERAMRRMGCDGRVFETKIESGWRSAWPSTYASEKVIEAGELVLIDIGPTYRGYFGDLTRTFVIGEPTPAQRRLLESVLAAQEAALARLGAGATGHEVDAAAREVLASAGYGDQFLHHTGHTLGLAGDSQSLLAPNVDSRLQAGECVTIEPGAYLPGIGGVRIEDEVLVTEDGYEYLTHFEKRIDQLVVAV